MADTMQIEREQHVCPYLQGSDERCARRFTLHRMSEVFEHCLGEYGRCNIYCELTVSCPSSAAERIVQAA